MVACVSWQQVRGKKKAAICHGHSVGENYEVCMLVFIYVRWEFRESDLLLFVVKFSFEALNNLLLCFMLCSVRLLHFLQVPVILNNLSFLHGRAPTLMFDCQLSNKWYASSNNTLCKPNCCQIKYFNIKTTYPHNLNIYFSC